MTAARVGLLTGAVGLGKTTVAGRVVGLARARGLTCGGLLAPALVDDDGQKVGVWGVDLGSGEQRVLARTDRDLGGPCMGRYSFDGDALEWAISAVERALAGPDRADLVVVDEIGKLELWAGTGLAPLLPRLAAGEAQCCLILVRDFLLPELDARLGSVERVVFRADAENRDGMPGEIVDNLCGCNVGCNIPAVG